jgi:hypothetical protein
MSVGSIWRLLLRGLGWGIVASLLGNIVFGVVAQPLINIVGILTYYPVNTITGVSVSLQDVKGMLVFSLYFIFLGLLNSLIPAAAGGVVLASLLKYLSSRVTNLLSVSAAEGGLVGGIAGVISSLLSLYSFPNLAYLAVLAWIIASVAGGLVGRRLALYIARDATTSSSSP